MAQNDEYEYPERIQQGTIGVPPNILYGPSVRVKCASLILTNTTTTAREVIVLHGDGVTPYFRLYIPDGGTPAAIDHSTVKIFGIEFEDGLALGGVVVNGVSYTLIEPLI